MLFQQKFDYTFNILVNHFQLTPVRWPPSHWTPMNHLEIRLRGPIDRPLTVASFTSYPRSRLAEYNDFPDLGYSNSHGVSHWPTPQLYLAIINSIDRPLTSTTAPLTGRTTIIHPIDRTLTSPQMNSNFHWRPTTQQPRRPSRRKSAQITTAARRVAELWSGFINSFGMYLTPDFRVHVKAIISQSGWLRSHLQPHDVWV